MADALKADVNAHSLKTEGNKLFSEGKFNESIEKFTQAISIAPESFILYSNRSGAYASLQDFAKALDDANKVTEIQPDWPKGWSRKATALHGQGDLTGACEAYNEALKLDPNNIQANSGLSAVKKAMEAESEQASNGGDPSAGLGNMFNDPQIIQKLANNPKTSHLLADVDFMAKLKRLKDNPKNIGAEMQDPRIFQVMGVLLGIDMQFGAPGAEEAGSASKRSEENGDTKMSDPPMGKVESEPEDENVVAERELKEKAEAEKTLGNENYRNRQFDAAIEHYTNAWNIRKDMAYMNNLGAAKFESGDYEGAIECCTQAVEYGREVLADFKLMAKAFGRIGSSYEKLDDLPKAIEYYQKSLTEQRTPEVLAKLRAAEKAQDAAVVKAYINPEEAEKARVLGNAKFKEGQWKEAVESYTEMIKRAPDDPRGYSNRAACFIKVMSFDTAVKDCDEAIKLDSKFIRAYLRKAQALFAIRQYSKCIDVCNQAMENDENGSNKREIEQQQQKALRAQYIDHSNETEEETMKRIQQDPEIIGILQDPVMQSILQQAKSNPASLQEHMKSPIISSKINKLMSAGVIRSGH